MELSVAANYDLSIIPDLAACPVTDVYGKLSSDLVGGGRASYTATGITLAHLTGYIAELKNYNIDFTYLLNSACLGNREWNRRWQKKLFRFLEKLHTAGVRRLTVSTPLLFQIIRKSFPEFYLKVGIFAQIDTPSRARYWEDLGADELTLESFSINRNFQRLAKIRKSVRCRLQLIVNHPCLPNCPIQYYHQNGLSHGSDGSRQIFIDYCFLNCSYRRLRDPSLFIKSQWIRPEDLATYEALGYSRFKLLERSIPSAQLLKRVRAYSQRQSTPNFAELILPHGFPEKNKRQWAGLFRHFFKPSQIKPSKLIPLYRLIKKQGILLPLTDSKIKIDASRIPPDFLDRFQQTDCTETDCTDCGYCGEIAGRAVKIDASFGRETMSRYEQFEAMLLTGEFWDVRR